jgi:hypothetical protein
MAYTINSWQEDTADSSSVMKKKKISNDVAVDKSKW